MITSPSVIGLAGSLALIANPPTVPRVTSEFHCRFEFPAVLETLKVLSFNVNPVIRNAFQTLIEDTLEKTCEFINTTIYRFFNLKEFWNWPFFYDYFFFTLLITIMLGFISNLIGYDNKTYVFILGMMTSMIEAFLDIPQIYELYISKKRR